MSQTTEYTELKAFLRFFSERFDATQGKAPQARPIALLESQERDSPAGAPARLRMAVNNCLETSGNWPLAKVSSLDSELRSKGILTLSQVRQRVWGRYGAVLKRGQVRNEVEYLLVRGVLADPALKEGLPASEREKLQAVSAAYEQQRPTPSIERTRSGLRPPRAAHVKR